MVVCILTWIDDDRCDEDGDRLDPQATCEAYGPFNSEEDAEMWESCLNPEVKGRLGYKAVIQTLLEPDTFR